LSLRRILAACARCPEIESQSSPLEAGERLPRGLDHIIVHVASVERMGMAKDYISADPALLEESFDTCSAALNWYPDRIFSHNPLLFGRHLIDYI
jgi:hypothetical protein